MSKIFKYILIIIMSMIMVAQICFINKTNSIKDVAVYSTKGPINKYKSLKEINE